MKWTELSDNISHGHSDHAGGLQYFLKQNQQAKIIFSPDAMSSKYFSKRENLHSITTEWPEIDDERLILIDQTYEVADICLAYLPNALLLTTCMPILIGLNIRQIDVL